MKLSLFTVATVLLASAEAAFVQFNVVSPGAKSVQVNVNGQISDLYHSDLNVPFYTNSIEVGGAQTYSYIADGKQEEFSRPVPAGNSTYNDYFGRPITYANIPALPRPLDNGKQWTRGDENPDLFDTNYIPSIFVNGDKAQLDNLIATVPKDKVTVELTMVGKNYVRTFSNVTLSISGAGKEQNPAKQSWRWTLSPGDTINNRFNFKIRHMEEDPTQMREKLYADVLRAMGTHANQANMIRYYINGEAFGTFNMLDDVKSYSYISAMFYNGQPPAQMGPLYDGATGASFAVMQDQFSYGSFKPSKGSPEGSEAIHEIAVKFSQLNLQDNTAIQEFDKSFDIDQFLRFMVMEYLSGSWDGYWEMQTNLGAYKDYANNNKWYYLGQDYDNTLGINMPVDSLQFSYKDYPAKNPNAVLINGFLTSPDLRATFESYISETVKKLFNNDTLSKHILAYREFIQYDLEWDRTITQRSPGWSYGWTFQNTYDNLFRSVEAPNNNGGGAEYGLIEWIDKKSKVAANDLGFQL